MTIPAEVDFAARYWGGDWTENIVPEVRVTKTGWTFDWEGQWFIRRLSDHVYLASVEQLPAGLVVGLPNGSFLLADDVARFSIDAEGVIVHEGAVQ